MRGVIASLSLVAAGATALEQGRVNLLFPARWTPENVVASVVSVEPTATTFALDCPPKASDDCSLYIRTVTQGPRTWAYGGEWEDIMGVDEYTLNNECAVRQKNDKMVCTVGVTQVKDGRTASTEIVSTTTGLSDFVYPIPITAGARKLQDEIPKPTRTSQPSSEPTESSTTVSSSTSVAMSTVLPTVNLAAADATKDAVASPTKEAEEESEDGGPVQETPSAVPAAAASMAKIQASVVGLAAFIGLLVL